MPYVDDSDVRAVLFDIDGTLTVGGAVWSVLIHSPDVVWLKKGWLYGTALPHYALSKAGIVAQAQFRDRWVRLMAWLMAGWSEQQVETVYQRTVQDCLVPDLRSDVVDILQQHKAAGHHVVLVSTMFEGIVAQLAGHLGADAGLGSLVLMQNGRCAGQIVGQTCSGGRKLDYAERHLSQLDPAIALQNCTAYADSASDIDFLAGVKYPVATYPADEMRTEAVQQGWAMYPAPD